MDDLGLPPLSKKAVGERLALTRSAFGLSQGAFAESAGIADNTYNQYEQGVRLPLVENALKLCERFDLTLDWIYRGDPSGLKYNLAERIIRMRRKRNTSSKR